MRRYVPGLSTAQNGFLAPHIDLGRFRADPAFRRQYLTTATTILDHQVTRDFFEVTDRFFAKSNGRDVPFEPGDGALATRSFRYDGVHSRFLANARTCQCGIIDSETLRKNSKAEGEERFVSSPLLQALNASKDTELHEPIYRSNCLPPKTFFIVDMCQSSAPWDPSIFYQLMSISRRIAKPVRITVAPAGRWIIGHFEAFKQLMAWHDDGMLEIEWANHTTNHPLNTDAGGVMQFMCCDQADLTMETLALELMLLEQGICPSLWFRFPGNKHTDNLLREVSRLSLIPLGITSWLERGDEVTVGSTVLVHANGNDVHGVRKAKEFLLDKRQALCHGELEICSASEMLS